MLRDSRAFLVKDNFIALAIAVVLEDGRAEWTPAAVK